MDNGFSMSNGILAMSKKRLFGQELINPRQKDGKYWSHKSYRWILFWEICWLLQLTGAGGEKDQVLYILIEKKCAIKFILSWFSYLFVVRRIMRHLVVYQIMMDLNPCSIHDLFQIARSDIMQLTTAQMCLNILTINILISLSFLFFGWLLSSNFF